MTDKPPLTSQQAAVEFQVTTETIRNWIRGGLLPAVKIGRGFRIKREDLDALMRRSEGETASLGTHRDLWDPKTLGLPFRPLEAKDRPSIWDGTGSADLAPERT